MPLAEIDAVDHEILCFTFETEETNAAAFVDAASRSHWRRSWHLQGNDDRAMAEKFHLPVRDKDQAGIKQG